MKQHSDRDMVKFEITQGVEMCRKSEIRVAVSSKITEGRGRMNEFTLRASAVVVLDGLSRCEVIQAMISFLQLVC